MKLEGLFALGFVLSPTEWKEMEMRAFSQQRILHLMSELILIPDRYEVKQDCY